MTMPNRFSSIIFEHPEHWQPARRNSYHACVSCRREPTYSAMNGWMVYRIKRVIAWACCSGCWQELLKSKKVAP
jgi:hypothetical protein